MSTGTFDAGSSQKAFFAQLKKVYGFYTGGFVAFCIVLAIAEQMGMSQKNNWLCFPVRNRHPLRRYRLHEPNECCR